MRRIGLIGLAMALFGATPAQAQQTVLVEYGIGLQDDFLVTINRYTVRRAAHLADVLASVHFVQPWTKPNVLASNQKWIRYRLDCNTGQYRRAVTEEGLHPLTRNDDPEGERILQAQKLETTPLGSPLHQAMCKGPEEKLSLQSPWPAYNIMLQTGPDPVPLVNPDVQTALVGGGMEESFARARFANAKAEALAGTTFWPEAKPVPGLPTAGFLPVAAPLTFHENLYKTVIDRGYVNFNQVLQWNDTLYSYNVYASGRTIHTKPGKVQGVHIIGVMLRCGPQPGQLVYNLVGVTPEPEKYQTLPLPRAATQWSGNLSEFSRALCAKQTSFAARPLATYEEARKALMNSLTPLPIGS
jgi:hypothetical protein